MNVYVHMCVYIHITENPYSYVSIIKTSDKYIHRTQGDNLHILEVSDVLTVCMYKGNFIPVIIMICNYNIIITYICDWIEKTRLLFS